MSEAVATMAATGAVSGVAEHAALNVVARIRQRVRQVFGSDLRSVDALERATEDPANENRLQALAGALAWYAQHDERFAEELVEWASTYKPERSVTQHV